MHVTNTYAILFIALAKTGDIGIPYDEDFFISGHENYQNSACSSSEWLKFTTGSKPTPHGDQNHSSG